MDLRSLDQLIVVLLIGSLALLAFIKISNPLKVNHKGNLCFGIFSIAWLSFWFEEWMDLAGIRYLGTVVPVAIHAVQIFTPILLYYSILFYSKPYFRFRVIDSIHLVIPVIYITMLIGIAFSSIPSTLLYLGVVVLLLFTALLYSSLSYYQIRHHRKQLLLFASNTQGVNLLWLEYIAVQLLLNTGIALGYNVLFNAQRSGIVINAVNVISVGFVAYHALRQKEIYPVDASKQGALEQLEEIPEGSPKRKLLSDQELEVAKQKLAHVMEHHRVYLESDINLLRLSEMLELSAHQLSFTLNSGFEMNFFQYINQYRIARAKELLATQSDTTTMLAIAFDSGFNSKTAFNTTFKKMTGETPTEFRKRLSGQG